MAFKKQKITDYFLLDTPVENIFINEYMAMAPGDYVKVYLMAQMYADLNMSLTNEEIAKHLGVDTEDVLKAWNYWEKMGTIRKIYTNKSDRFNYDVEFVVLKGQLYGSGSAQTSPAAEPGVNPILSDNEVKEMFGKIEKAVGRTINSTEMNEVLSWITDYQSTPEIIAYAFAYCAKKKKTSIKYVNAVISNWNSEGLRTIEAIEEALAISDKKQHIYKRVFQALGFSRNASEEERRIIDSWFDTMNLSMNLVLDACSKTAGITNPNINYVNKVLTSWYEEGKEPKKNENNLSASDIRNYYEMVRTRMEAEAEDRRREVYAKVPRIREIENELTALGREITKLIISNAVNKEEESAKIQMRTDELNMEKVILLTDNGFEMDHMDVKYQCSDCKDTGRLETGEKCQCYQTITMEKLQQEMTLRR